MSLILRMFSGTEKCIDTLDINKCLRGHMTNGIHAIVFKYNIFTNKIEIVLVEQNIKLAYDWAIYANEKEKYPTYQVMYMLNRKHGYMMTTHKISKPAVVPYRCSVARNEDTYNGKLHWDSFECEDMQRERYCKCHLEITGKHAFGCTCKLCESYHLKMFAYLS